MLPLDPCVLADKFRKLPEKTPGPDGWTYAMFKSLDRAALSDLSAILHEAEQEGQWPQQISLTCVTLIPKKLTEERPIALTHVVHRSWCKLRWPEVLAWQDKYSLVSPWDRARLGGTAIDPALRRAIRFECSVLTSFHQVSLFIDLRQFYEHVQHHRLVDAALAHDFPAWILSLALSVYRGPRYLEGQAMLSAPVYPDRGIAAGCPLAPCLSKLALHEIASQLWESPSVHHLDVFIDDLTVDCKHQKASVVAQQAYSTFRKLRDAVCEAGLPLSVDKSCFICSSPQSKKELAAWIEVGDPPINDHVRDLGVDCGGGVRRRENHPRHVCWSVRAQVARRPGGYP